MTPSCPNHCNSSHSEALGWLQTLPSTIRLIQCLRRYYDTRRRFPNLANAAKYIFTILQYASLSQYRIQRGSERMESFRAAFIVCATLNTLYASTWDLLIDWSLLDFYAPHRFLRVQLAFKRAWWYYIAIVADPLLRFGWLLYLFPDKAQYTALLIFGNNLLEIARRSMWILFRVENEHYTDVGRLKAFRAIELPYPLPTDQDEVEEQRPNEYGRRPSHADDYTHQIKSPVMRRSSTSFGSLSPGAQRIPAHPYTTASGTDLEAGAELQSPLSVSSRRQSQEHRMPSPRHADGPRSGSSIFARLQSAHTQDYGNERRMSKQGLDRHSHKTHFHHEDDSNSNDDEDNYY